MFSNDVPSSKYHFVFNHTLPAKKQNPLRLSPITKLMEREYRVPKIVLMVMGFLALFVYHFLSSCATCVDVKVLQDRTELKHMKRRMSFHQERMHHFCLSQ